MDELLALSPDGVKTDITTDQKTPRNQKSITRPKPAATSGTHSDIRESFTPSGASARSSSTATPPMERERDAYDGAEQQG